MNYIARAVVLLGFASPLAVLVSTSAADTPGGPASDRAATFELTDVTGTPLTLRSKPEAKLTIVCFLGTECPLATLYAGRLQNLANAFSSRGVTFIGLNSNRQDSSAELAEFACEQNVTFPLGKDFDNIVADQFQVVRTPEVIVIDQSLSIRYRGRVDDQYLPGVSRSQPRRDDLKIAIEELLEGRSVSVPRTKPEGCLLGRVTKPAADATVTFCDQVVRVLQRNCVECHHAGDIGPFSLTEYDEVIGWGDMMVEVIDNQRMPPWHADPTVGHFANERIMSDADKQVIRDWVDQGMPYGKTEQLPEPQTFATGWQLPRDPDQVIAMRKRPFTIPADGTVEYQYFVVDPKFTEDVWVSDAEVIPGNRSVVHHSIVFIRPPDGTRMTGIGWLAAYVPGQRLPNTRPNLARRIPAGSRLVFQQHYTPNGRAQADLTKIGLVFANEKDITEERLTLAAINQGFELKPNRAGQDVNANVRQLPTKGMLLAIAPHMHYRGNQFSATLVSQAGEKDTLRVPNYDFNWQHNYELSEPIDLGTLTAIKTTFVFDNSDDNTFNPDPSSYVTWGDQTWEEMAIAFFDVAIPRKPKTDGSNAKGSTAEGSKANLVTNNETATDPKIEQRIQQQTDLFLERFDSDGNGLIERSELPLAIQAREFGRADANGDKSIDRQELTDRFRARIR